jgi:ABC-type sugar transport system permease subunit
MYYYGYNSGYPANYSYGNQGYNNFGYGAAIILVLFILLVIIFGVGFWNNGGCGCNSCNN